MIDIAHRRLNNQQIASHSFAHPADLVGWMGMLQAQDYLGALWAVGLRMQNASEIGIEQALAERSIIRTWPARGTLHFVSANDVRWILELLAPRIITRSAGRYRQLSLTESDFERSRGLFVEALQGGNRLTRDEMYQVLETGGIATAGQRGIHILGRLAQESLICFGPRAGKQQTFVLLAEWAPNAENLTRDQGLAEIIRRYFTGHGPATLADFVWWSGMTMADARTGVEMVKSQLVKETIEGVEYWRSQEPMFAGDPASSAFLLPAFDEYLMGYKDRRAVLDPEFVKQTNAGGGMLNPIIVIDGQVVGTWKRSLKKRGVMISPAWFDEPTRPQKDALIQAAESYAAFLNTPALLE